MNTLDQLLFSVISNIIFNKFGNLACGSEPEFLTMACIMQQRRVNISYLMMRRMEACARKKSPLLYAAFVSKILKHFKVSPHFHNREEYTIIDSNSIRWMNFTFAQNEWVRLVENMTIRRVRKKGSYGRC